MSIDPVIFRQYDIRGTVGDNLTPEVAKAVGLGFGSEARDRLGKVPTIAVGRDNRPSGVALSRALMDGLMASGANVLSAGLLPTPSLYFAIQHLGADAGVQVTGSHNPPEFNGFKMVLGGLPFAGDDITGLLKRIQQGRFAKGMGKEAGHGVLEAYERDVIRHVGRLGRQVKVVVDCGNGTASVAGPQLLRAQGGRHRRAVLRVRRLVPQPPSRSDRSREPGRPPGGREEAPGRDRHRVRRRRRPHRRGG